MIDLPPAPSKLLKSWARLTRWVLGLLVAAWLLFGLAWGALHWVIVPRIGEFRPLLEAQASKLLGIPVRIGTLVAYSNGLIPSVELTDVRLLDPEGHDALLLPRVLLAVSPQSLSQLEFEMLYVERPQLNIRRAPDGKIYVAGFDVSLSSGPDSAVADWLFSQAEFSIHDGTLVWTDEQRGVPPLALQQVDLVLRNGVRTHELRFDATPPAAWGERFSLLGKFQQPLLSLHNNQWKQWKGQIYASYPRVDLSALRRYVDLGVDLTQGNGALNAWADVNRGEISGVVADVALAEVSVRLAASLKPLELKAITGRLGGSQLDDGFNFFAENLQFDTRDGLHWPGGNVRVSYLAARGQTPARGEAQADKLDLAAVAQIVNRLPLDETVRARLLAYAPTGQVQQMQASWQGPWQALSSYQVKGTVQQLALAAQVSATKPVHLLSPGLRGADMDFDFNQSAGKASLKMAVGSLDLPGVFEEPVLALNQLSADVRWQLSDTRLSVQVPNLTFSNADAQGEAQMNWETAAPDKARPGARFPGVLDLQGSLSRANGARVYRYLPLSLGRQTRDYVREAVVAGTASDVKFKVKGDLSKLPFLDARQGEFRISADVQNASYNYVPRASQAPGEPPWPALSQFNGELVIDRTQLQLKGVRARLGNSTVQISKAEALITDLGRASVVNVTADARGPLAEMLGLVNSSPVGSITAPVLAKVSANALADYKLKLQLPLDNLDKATVQGSVTLTGNDIQFSPDTPKLIRARGLVNFTESSVTVPAVPGLQARMLGGDVRLDGAWDANAASRTGAPAQLRISGALSAEGLRQARELGLVARLAQFASGSTNYTAVLGWRRGAPEISVNSNLQGLALNLPAPFNKSAEAVLPLRVENALLPDAVPLAPGAPQRQRDQITVDLGRVAAVSYVRDVSGPEPRVLRGSVAVGLLEQEAAPMPDEGVQANINLKVADLDAWSEVFEEAAGVPAKTVASNPRAGGAASTASSYLPTRLAVRAQEFTLGGRKLNNVVAGGSRDGQLWRANLDARELSGYLEYRQPSDSGAGRLYARLARLTIEPAVASDVEALLSEQPASLPALDVVVDDFEWRGKDFGRLEVDAVNRGGVGVAREWRLNKLNLIMPEAVLSASGNWANVNAPALGRNVSVPRRTALNFKLDIKDSGELLGRFGMKGVVRRGRGKLEGQMAWMGSPFNLDYPSLGGAFVVNIETGQFLKADPGIAKLLGVLSLQSLPRRLTLDFKDVFSEGFVFDYLRGDITIDQGIASTNNLQMKGVNAAVLMDGRADIARETQDVKVVVVPELNAGTASLIASVINPAVGLGTFLAQLFLRKPLMEAATQEFHIDGSWVDPKITKVERKAPAAKDKPDSKEKTGTRVEGQN
jgi:uncharacterized protein (TIGR02099 family)